MSYLQTFQVFPNIPEELSFLVTLSRNMWWCWHLDAIELFRRINPRLWEKAGRNPILFSTMLSQERLRELAEDESFLAHQEKVKVVFERQVLSPKDYSETPFQQDKAIAYFSMEFGIHESLPLFAGGLGILAGDHLKAASDMALPLVGVGILYRKGYFTQFLNQDGWQQEEYNEIDIYNLPLKRAIDPSGNEVHVLVKGPTGQDIKAVVWELNAGRISIFLLDTNLHENPPEVREITDRLYLADEKIRLAQEVLLGIGGMQALRAMGINPKLCHMNEGHCAFAGLERLVQTMSTYNVDLKVAREIVSRTMIFTTHTPVAAGHDEFPSELVKPCLAPLAGPMSVDLDEIISWGRPDGSGPDAPFSMFVLALRLSQYCNGVSELHGRTARRMWAHVWPGRHEDEVPITHVTNGVHIPSWISIENSLLFDRYLGPEWYMKTQNMDTVNRIDAIYDEELWRTHEMSRSRLVRTCRSLMIRQYSRRNAPTAAMQEAESVLDQDILTIAFARRFATYKRANLLLQDPERFKAILTSEKYPVQLIFSGKAHPKDDGGKDLIRRLIEFARQHDLSRRIIFIENYDISVARHLIQGADIWLNTPRRPFEACGTSGIKAAVNGVLNMSVLDGWWCEGYSEEAGWRIGNGEEYDDYGYQDGVESQALYNILENDVIPCFYDRKDGGVPGLWVKKMKSSMKMAMHRFSAIRMIGEYESKFYKPAAERAIELSTDGLREAKRLNALHERLKEEWRHIRIDHPVRKAEDPFLAGNKIHMTVQVFLGKLQPEEVEVELYYGIVKSIDEVKESRIEKMNVTEDRKDCNCLYSCTITCNEAGRYGFTARVTPTGDDRIKYTPGLICWA